MMSRKTFSSFTNEEMNAFQSREQRIRELQQALAVAATQRVAHGGVFAGLYT
jgi:LPS O-antigen subunit length determinant protein (WzzB/FepE family)